MIRRHLFALRSMLLVADALVAALVFVLVGTVRFGDAAWTTMWEALSVDPWVGAALYAFAWTVTLWYLGLYAFRVRWTVAGELNDILIASFVVAFGTMSFLYLVQVTVSRLFIIILLVAQPAVTILSRLALRGFFNWLRARGYNRCYMLVIGTGPEAQAFADALERHRDLGIEVIGHLRGPAEDVPAVTRPILGDGEELQRVFHERVVDEVAMCVDPAAVEWSEPLIRLAADEGKLVRISSQTPARTFDLQTEELDGLQVRSFVYGPTRMLSLATKRGMDVAGAAVGLVLLSPVFLVAAIAIVVSDGRPVLYHHTRIGLHGRPFTLHKFRTMVRDADARFEEVRHLNERSEVTFKADDDPRITRLGRFLRATSIDELPQLWNVLRGRSCVASPPHAADHPRGRTRAVAPA